MLSLFFILYCTVKPSFCVLVNCTESQFLCHFQCDFLPLEQVLCVSIQAPAIRYVYHQHSWYDTLMHQLIHAPHIIKFPEIKSAYKLLISLFSISAMALLTWSTTCWRPPSSPMTTATVTVAPWCSLPSCMHNTMCYATWHNRWATTIRTYRIVWSRYNLGLNHCGLVTPYWRHRFRSTLARVMAWCLMAPSHYLSQCWLIISGVLWHAPESNFTRIVQEFIP